MFSKTWQGTRYGYAELQNRTHPSDTIAGTVYSTKSDCSDTNIDYLLCIKPVNSILMTQFNGKVICGKRMGPTFIDAARPNHQTGLCPDSKSPCSSSTSIQNTICLPQ